MLVNNDKIDMTFIKYFAETVEKLNTFKWPSHNENKINETLTQFIKNSRINQVSSRSSTIADITPIHKGKSYDK